MRERTNRSNGNLARTSDFTSTRNEAGARWQVDLEKAPQIDQIVLVNRTDSANRLNNFRVTVRNAAGQEVWGKNYNYSSSAPEVSTTSIGPGGQLRIDGNTTGDNGVALSNVSNGRFVRVALNGSNTLSLVEVQVWSDDSDGLIVDTNATSYDYDSGTITSPVQSGWTQFSNQTVGDLCRTGGPLNAIDRGSSPGVNNINRDYVYARQTRTLNHKIANGAWDVVINSGDTAGARDNLSVVAEGVTLSADTDSTVGQFSYVTGRVTVTDGELNLTLPITPARIPIGCSTG